MSPELVSAAAAPMVFQASASAPPSRHERVSALAVMVVAALVALALFWTRRHYVPLWDGRIYADCVVDAATRLASPGAYRCAGHISQSYVGILAVMQRLVPWPVSLAPMLLANAALLLLAAYALLRLLRLVFPDPSHALGRALVVACFLLQPVILGAAVQPGLDFGVLVFSLCALAAALEGRRWAFIGFGLLLVFAKEPGLPVYGVIALAYAWRHGLRQIVPGAARWLAVTLIVIGALANVVTGNLLSAGFFILMLLAVDWRALRPSRPPVGAVLRAVLAQWTLALPILLVGGYLAANLLRNALAPAQTAEQGAQVVWGNTSTGSLVKTVFRSGVIDQPTLAVLAMIFVLGFMWLPTLVILVDLLVAMARRRRHDAARLLAGVDAGALGMIAAVFIGELWFLSRFRTFANARYYVPLYPLLLVVAYGALVRLGVSRHFRAGAFAVLALLLGVSTVRTADPVSSSLWGTFQVGEHRMLRMTSLTDECCGYGRDQLAYNLQFTIFDALQSTAYARMQPDARTALVMAPTANWETVGPLDPVTHRRVLRRDGTIAPPVLDGVQAYRVIHVPAGWFVEIPYMDNAESILNLREVYELGEPQWVYEGGYAMAVRTMRLRSAPLGRQPTGAPAGAPSAASVPK